MYRYKSETRLAIIHIIIRSTLDSHEKTGRPAVAKRSKMDAVSWSAHKLLLFQIPYLMEEWNTKTELQKVYFVFSILFITSW